MFSTAKYLSSLFFKFFILVFYIYFFCEVSILDYVVDTFEVPYIESFSNYFIDLILWVFFLNLIFYYNVVCDVSKSDSFNRLYLVFFYKVSFIKNFLLFSVFDYFFNFFFFFIKFFFNKFLFLKEFFFIFSNNVWYPVFKRHSYFGLFRVSRDKWIDLKTENLNFYKH